MLAFLLAVYIVLFFLDEYGKLKDLATLSLFVFCQLLVLNGTELLKGTELLALDQ